MKIAFIKRNFSYHGGAEKYLASLIDFLKKENHEIHIFSNKWLKDKRINFHKVKILPFGSFLKAWSFNRNLKINLKEYDCVVSFERTNSQHIYRAGEGCHRKWLEIRKQTEPFYKKISFKINPLHIYYLRLEKEIFEKTPLIIANSEMVKNEIIENYKISPEKIIVVYNGVDLSRFSSENRKKFAQFKKDMKLSEGEKILLFLGSGFKRKGLETLIKALPYVNENVKLLIIGKGNPKEYLNMAKKSGIYRKILFLGPQREIEKFYAISDLFVLPTLYDPFSNATLEAMASGIPVITTKNNGVAELIEDGSEGYVLKDLLNPQELANKINLALKNLTSMSFFARRKAEKFPIEEQAKKILEVIKCLKKSS
ncbi:MAG: glycosyltransferase family 4 protein [Thermodesulfovibrio sp.]|uniref:glycosyltransferase family 4 protein n=1 Tax=unclassified Thermodesulfovibrio TaxID=2645936 RepID=UPI000839E2DB|nr:MULTISPECIES: glycosyltransferase family 4 protein [unclassified Thermodesulfovibrio]MDI1471026.1 glycosyltransferase family 4 protein [Thermodesulfovibrio sp. 1176]MDI6713876.1 glycosyltransferase family 4 protein [Thermodesulfovibrio sp.]ODA43517.1 Glycosyltransferase [Thermodesulfovibrio sp. N1]